MERSNRAFVDPTEFWRQWYEATSRVWTDALKVVQGGADPYGLYRQWFGLADGRERAGAVSPGSMPGMGGMPQMDQKSVQENVQRWLAMTAETYRKAAQTTTGLLDLGPRWLRMLEEVRENLFNGEAIPTDPLSFGVRWYNATSEPLSRFVGEIMESEVFLESSSRFFENYASLYRAFSKNSEEYLRTLQLPTRSDMSRIAGLVVALEDKVDIVEEVLEGVEDGHVGLATTEAVGAVEGRIGNLEERLDRVEGKLDRLLTAVEASVAPTGRNGVVEASQEAPRAEIRATAAARRKAAELNVDLAEVKGTGPNGQITVGDVRKKGES